MFENKFSNDVFLQKYSMNSVETWPDACRRVIDNVMGGLVPAEIMEATYRHMVARRFIPAGRYLYYAGRPFHQYNNCFTFRAEDSREGWSDLMEKATMSLMTGGGIGVDYSNVREEGAPIQRTGGKATGPIALMKMTNEAGRYIMQGGQRRSAIWAGLDWKHPDIDKFLHLKDYPAALRAAKEADFTFPLPMELTNISVIYGTDFFQAIRDKSHPLHSSADNLWYRNCRQAFKTAEPGMAFNYLKDLESLRNACTELVSEDDSDKCNLGTVWMNYCRDLSEFQSATSCGTLFLLCGGIRSDTPTEKIGLVGSMNNRIGLGLGGIHEWLMQRGLPYAVEEDLANWLDAYQGYSEDTCVTWCPKLKVKYPKGIRAIAPNGTIGIIAETTTGIEPLFCKAYRRRYFKNGAWEAQYVVDGSVKRLLAQGIPIEQITDAYDLSFEQRVAFQADVQDYVDMAISSTANMPSWLSETNNEEMVATNASILLKYAHRLRGFTCYPDGARGGQPLTRVTLEEALANEGKVVIESSDICDIAKGSTCGS